MKNQENLRAIGALLLFMDEMGDQFLSVARMNNA